MAEGQPTFLWLMLMAHVKWVSEPDMRAESIPQTDDLEAEHEHLPRLCLRCV
jgi:hypothetical protein